MPTAQLRKRGRIVELYFGHRYGGWTIYDDLDPAPSRDARIAEASRETHRRLWG